jgi:hypothetical protein
MRHYTTNENYGEDILKAMAKIEALENNFKLQKDYFQKEADEFAIGFAEWFNNLKYDVMRYKTMEEHLELYKKEKGL